MTAPPQGTARRVLVVTSSYPEAPDDFAGEFVRTGVRALAARGHRVTVLHPSRRDAPQGADDPGVETRGVRWTPWRSALARQGGMPEALERSWLARAEAPLLVRALRAQALALAASHDAVIGHWLVPGALVAASAARRRGIPAVGVAHSACLHLLAGLPGGAGLAARIADGLDRIVAVSEDARARLLGLLPPDAAARTEPRVRVVPNPLPDEAFAAPAPGVPGGGPRAVFLGRLVPVKGADVLLDALAPGDAFETVVAGAGPLEEPLRARVAARGLRVRFAGTVAGDAKWRLLDGACVVVVPSRVLPGGRTEGLPVVVAEAFARGVPVVASRVGGVAEFVKPGETGWLVPEGDAAALREAVLAAVALGAAARAEVAAACRRRVECCGSARYALAMEGILAEAESRR